MKSIECTIFVEPVAKGRPRIAVIGGHARAYTPKKTANAESDIKAMIRQTVMEQGCFDAGMPLRVDATFYREKPKSTPKRVTMPVSKPDLTNYLKLLEDALNKYVYPDDNQIVTIHARKRFVENGNVPRIEVKICEVVD